MSKLGGLPKYTFKPRKPVPLGTMFRNGAKCISGVLVFQDVVQLTEVQARKKFFNEKSYLPGDSTFVTAHAAEVLRQVHGRSEGTRSWLGWQ